MNRRSILSSLVSMFVAALAWPRHAEAARNNYKTDPSALVFAKVYNGFYLSGTGLIPGQYAINVYAYGQTQYKITMTGGAIRLWSKIANNSTEPCTIDAASAVNANAKFQTVENQGYGTTLYFLVNSSGPNAVPTITRAPAGVRF